MDLNQITVPSLSVENTIAFLQDLSVKIDFL